MNKTSTKKHISKLSIGIIILAIIGAGFFIYEIKQRYPEPKIPIIKTSPPPTPHTLNPAPSLPPFTGLPGTLLLKVPFTPQAPTANWDELHNEACEEASSIMVDAYFENENKNNYDKNADGVIDADYVEGQISKLTTWENTNLGYHLDTTSEETVQMITSVYNLSAKVDYDFSEQKIKQELAQGNLVIISFDGRLLNNPNFRQPGPPHHMLVVTGYTSQGFVTNDPGTRRGQNYAYDFDTLYNAAGDWVHSEKAVDVNKKIIIIVKK